MRVVLFLHSYISSTIISISNTNPIPDDIPSEMRNTLIKNATTKKITRIYNKSDKAPISTFLLSVPVDLI